MIGQAIALATGVITLVVMWQAGNHKAWAWALGLGNQVLWLAFIVAFGAWGLLPLTAWLTVVYARNLRKWRREREQEPWAGEWVECRGYTFDAECRAVPRHVSHRQPDAAVGTWQGWRLT